MTEFTEVEERFDEAAPTRQLSRPVKKVLYVVALVFAVYHFLTAGFGLPVDHWHMGFHLSGLFILTYALFPLLHRPSLMKERRTPFRIGNVPLYDLVFMVIGVVSSLYIGLAWRGIDWLGVPEQIFRQGAPTTLDLFMGGAMIVLVLDLARRTLGWVLPAIICLFMSYALFGQYFPGLLNHPGVSFRQFVNNMYFPQEGIFGITLWVVSTTVFHFVLFGVIAQRTGLGQLFIENAQIMAGRYRGGPAKVSVVSSAFFGTISGSSVANTVSTGSLTIPNMKRLGYPGHFAGGVEAASSAGGQITPPIMGAAAFIMAEYLNMPYTTIVIAAIFPALLHYIGVFAVVHLMARKLNLSGMDPATLPRLKLVWKAGWANILPLVALIAVLFSGYTPFLAAFCGISLALITGSARKETPLTLLMPLAFLGFVGWKFATGAFDPIIAFLLVACTVLGLFNPQRRIGLNELADAVETGVRYSLAVGAAAAAVGIVVGVVNTTGIGFRVGFMVTSGASQIAESLHSVISFGAFELASQADLQFFLSLALVALCCILMGAGIPTTALYIMLVSVAQPALAEFGVPPIASHMFVLYYGVVSEITPPVCTSAYAAAAIANSNPFRTGISAFTLGLGKVVAPMAFVYAPVLLFVSTTGFNLGEFIYVALSCIAGVISLSAAVVGHFRSAMGPISRLLAGSAGLIFIAPDWQADLVALLVLSPVAVFQMLPGRSASLTKAEH